MKPAEALTTHSRGRDAKQGTEDLPVPKRRRFGPSQQLLLNTATRNVSETNHTSGSCAGHQATTHPETNTAAHVHATTKPYAEALPELSSSSGSCPMPPPPTRHRHAAMHNPGQPHTQWHLMSIHSATSTTSAATAATTKTAGTGAVDNLVVPGVKRPATSQQQAPLPGSISLQETSSKQPRTTAGCSMSAFSNPLLKAEPSAPAAAFGSGSSSSFWRLAELLDSDVEEEQEEEDNPRAAVERRPAAAAASILAGPAAACAAGASSIPPSTGEKYQKEFMKQELQLSHAAARHSASPLGASLDGAAAAGCRIRGRQATPGCAMFSNTACPSSSSIQTESPEAAEAVSFDSMGEQHDSGLNTHLLEILESSTAGHTSNSYLSLGNTPAEAAKGRAAATAAPVSCSDRLGISSRCCVAGPDAAEVFLDACGKPEMVAALATLMHADLLPFRAADGTGCLLTTLSYMLTVAKRAQLQQLGAHQLLTLLWMTESFMSQYRAPCATVLFDYKFYAQGLDMEDLLVRDTLGEDVPACIQIQLQVLKAANFRLWVSDPELEATGQQLRAAQDGACLIFLQGVLARKVQGINQQLLQQLQEQQAALQQQRRLAALGNEDKPAASQCSPEFGSCVQQQHQMPVKQQPAQHAGPALSRLDDVINAKEQQQAQAKPSQKPQAKQQQHHQKGQQQTDLHLQEQQPLPAAHARTRMQAKLGLGSSTLTAAAHMQRSSNTSSATGDCNNRHDVAGAPHPAQQAIYRSSKIAAAGALGVVTRAAGAALSAAAAAAIGGNSTAGSLLASRKLTSAAQKDVSAMQGSRQPTARRSSSGASSSGGSNMLSSKQQLLQMASREQSLGKRPRSSTGLAAATGTVTGATGAAAGQQQLPPGQSWASSKTLVATAVPGARHLPPRIA